MKTNTSSIKPYLTLLRPANVVTSVADVLAGTAIAASVAEIEISGIILLLLSTAGLYAGGIVFNDVFDLKIDSVERPERPIPSGKVPLKNAIILGCCCFLIGIVSAFFVSRLSGSIAILITVTALLYDRFMKHNPVAGPVFMGTARGMNLLLGLSIAVPAIRQFYWLGIIPFIFIASVTLTSRKENQGNNRMAMVLAMWLDTVVLGILVYTTYFYNLTLWALVMFIWFGMVISAKFKAYHKNTPQNIKKAVKTGVMSLIILDATYAFIFGEITYAVAILLLFPLSMIFARKFAVT